MNAESIKLITEALSTLGASGKEAFVWWLAINYGLAYLLGLMWTAIGAFAVYRGANMLRQMTTAYRIARALGTYLPLTDIEIDRICEKVRGK